MKLDFTVDPIPARMELDAKTGSLDRCANVMASEVNNERRGWVGGGGGT